jgi:hypothetical protein
MKHNKKRNTAFVYETLTRELTKAIVNKDQAQKSAVLKVLREHFSGTTILGRHLEFYKVLLETTNLQEKVATRLLHETKEACRKLDENTIFDAQSRLIAAINKGLGQDVWANFIPNFKSLASVDGIFSSKIGVKKRVLFEQDTLDRMSSKPSTIPATLQPIDNLTYHSFIKKFNDKYGSLLQEQQALLSQYVTSFADDGFELRLYLNEEISRLKDILVSTSTTTLDSRTSRKMTEVIDYLDGFRMREFVEKDLGKVLKVQALTQELMTND